MTMSLGVAVAYVAGNNWFGAGDLPGLLAWTLPLAVLIHLAFRLTATRLAGASSAWGYVILPAIGGVLGLGWTMLAAFLLGGWIMAFSFPVLFCWVAGGLGAGIAAACLLRPRGWPAAVVLAAGVLATLLRLNAYALAPEPRVRVVLAPGTTHAEEEQFWQEVIGRPGQRPAEFDLLHGISGAGITDYEAGGPVFTVSFDKALSREVRDSLIARIRGARIVARVDTITPSDSSGVHVSPSH